MKNNRRQTMLHVACGRSDFALSFGPSQERWKAFVQLLLEKEVDITAADASGETALHKAAKIVDKVIVKVLLENGADINAKNF